MQYEEIVREILDYIYTTNPVAAERKPLPLDDSLYELGILDSFAVIELVSFMECRWSIVILDSEITKEKLGGIRKMASFIEEKISSPERVGRASSA